MSESTATATPALENQEKALRNWQNLLGGFNLRQELNPEGVIEVLMRMSESHVKLFQLALKGTRYHTEKLDPDGLVGQETSVSLKLLFSAAGSPGKQS